MRCRECEGLLWSYLDGELGKGQRHAVEAHLAVCPRCPLALEHLRNFPLRPGQLTAATPPPDFTARLMRRIAPLPPPCDLLSPARRQELPRHPLGGLLAFAAAAAAVLLGLISTSALALLSGQSGVAPFGAGRPVSGRFSIADLLARWSLSDLWSLLSWPVLGVIAGMLIVLSLLWARSVAPRRDLDRWR